MFIIFDVIVKYIYIYIMNCTELYVDDEKLKEIILKRNSINEDIMNVEKQIYELETSYFKETGSQGNVVKGWTTKNLNFVKSDIVNDDDRFILLLLL